MRNYLIIQYIFALLAVFFAAVSSTQADNKELKHLKQAVIKIYATRAAPDYFTPWRLMNLEQSSGSGAVIDDHRILTNAHVIADARYLQVQKHNDPKKYLAQVAFVSHEADLAIVEVQDKSFFNGLKALSIGELPAPLTEVSVFGFPFGGQSLSITTGILSRVEHQRYAHAGSYLLAGQIDAAINPGNSGGPVIADNQIVGVVMQANSGSKAENQGYFVPPTVIKHVIEDARDGSFEGIPDLGFRTQNLESPASKRANGLSPNAQGALVTKVFEDSSAFGLIQENDVLLSINGHAIADDETIELAGDLRTDYKYIVDNLHPGDLLTLSISRLSKTHQIELAADLKNHSRSLVRGLQYDQKPRYMVYGGVVFVPLNMNLIKRWGRDWHSQAPIDFLHSRARWATPERRELVVALKVLADDVNLGYHSWSNWIISEVNGNPIRDFNHFAELLHNFSGDFVRISDDKGYQLVLDHGLAVTAEPRIREIYGLPSSFSVGLFEQFAVSDVERDYTHQAQTNDHKTDL